MLDINKLLNQAVLAQASDLLITVGVPPMLRIHGSLTAISDVKVVPEIADQMLHMLLTERQYEKFKRVGEFDFAYSLPNCCRFRVNAFVQQGFVSIAIRVLNDKILDLQTLGLPSALETVFADCSHGLILVVGPTGCGKSTTAAALIDYINSSRSCHILTLEDPIEFKHSHKKSVINQREVGTDTLSFAASLRSALRENPDVIFLGEMRDLETIQIALTAAETGHRILATIHSSGAVQTISRIIDAFPAERQQQIRIQISLSLQAIVHQQLISRKDKQGRILAYEILVATPAVRNIIRTGAIHQLYSIIQTGADFGMLSMDQCLEKLYKADAISLDNALKYATDKNILIQGGPT